MERSERILIGMSGVEFGAHQNFVFKRAFGSTVVMTFRAALGAGFFFGFPIGKYCLYIASLWLIISRTGN